MNAAGAAATTFSTFDSIDGGAGTDTLNIFSDGTQNAGFPASASVKNVEIVNINNSTAAGYGNVDASNFVGATQVWQAANANDVSNLAATTAAGLRNVTAEAADNLTISAAATATSASVALENLKGDAATGAGTVQNQAEVNVNGAALTAVNVSGSLAQTTTTAGAAAASLALGVTLGADVQAATVNTGVATTLTIDNAAASTKELTSVDASASTGAVTYTSAGTDVATIKGGSGDDTLTIATATVKDNAATAADETVSALVEGGAGKDSITINTTGTGTTTVNAGDGNDTVTLAADGSGKLTVNLGEGDDTFTVSGTGVVSKGDSIDAGAGSDTLLLSLVGSANVGAFSNFDVYDVAGMTKNLDLNILNANNTVTELVGSAALGGNVTLQC